MAIFIIGAISLLALVALVVLMPKRSTRPIGQDINASNVQWYREREQELIAQADSDLLDDARLRLLEDTSRSENAPTYKTGFAKWPILVALAVGAVALYWQTGAAQDVVIARQLAAIDHNAAPDALAALVQDMEARLKQHPDHEQYASLLAQYYMNQQRYGDSVKLYERLLARYPEDDRLLAAAAQAQYLDDERNLTPKTLAWLERAVAVNPHQRTALGLLGMASFEAGQYAAAKQYWQQLLVGLTPQSPDAKMMQNMVALADERLGAEHAPAPAQLEVDGVGVRIALSAPDHAITAGDAVFVLVRPANVDTRMPIAVQRFTGANLPREIVLDNSHSMAGQQLSDAMPVTVAVQVSPSGQPGAANATWQGEVSPVTPSATPELVTVVLEKAATGR